MAQGKRHKPTSELRTVVENLCIGGFTQDQIADALEISDDTLRKYYAKELGAAKIKFNSKVVGILRKKILQDEDTASIFFYLKTQMGWRETNRTEITGADGGPIKLAAVDRPAPETMEQWIERTERERLERKAAQLQQSQGEVKRLPDPQKDEP